MRKEQVKTGVLSIILLSSVVQLASCAAKMREQKEEVDNHPVESIEPSDILSKPVIIQIDGETIGTIEVNPNIYSILDEKGYSLSDYPGLSREILDSHEFRAFDNQVGVTNTDVNFRMGPGTEYDIIEAIYPDRSVELVARCDNGWYLICYHDKLGFVRGDFINQVSDQELSDELQNLPDVMKFVQATSDVRIRPEANTDQQEYGLLLRGQSLEMVRRLDNGWYEVIYNGQTAYVCGDYVKETYALSGDVEKMAFANGDIPLYRVPFGEITSTISQYQSFKIYKEIDGYYYVECDGQIGFISKADCIELTGTYVIVDISNQSLSLYQGTNLLLESSVVTGKDSSPTDIGYFDIDAKATDAWLTGADYSTHVNFWMPYNGGEGLHDALWRSAFGGEIYHDNGSHGCVNCPYDTAEFLYNNLNVGDKVLVKG